MEQRTQRKAVFKELTENAVYVNHSAKSIKGGVAETRFTYLHITIAYSYISLKITNLLHDVFSQSSRIPWDLNFLA